MVLVKYCVIFVMTVSIACERIHCLNRFIGKFVFFHRDKQRSGHRKSAQLYQHCFLVYLVYIIYAYCSGNVFVYFLIARAA